MRHFANRIFWSLGIHTRVAKCAFILLALVFLLNSGLAVSEGWIFYQTSESLHGIFPSFYRLINFCLAVMPALSLFFLVFLLARAFISLKKRREKQIFLVILLVFFLFLEFGLKMLAYKPGVFGESRWFEPVSVLHSLHGFTADASGITKIDPEVRNYIRTGKTAVPNDLRNFEVYGLRKDYQELKNGKSNAPLSALYSKLLNSGNVDAFSRAVLDYLACPVNEQGFKSIAFRKITNRKPSVLILGDSFSWGHSASNRGDGFADKLLAKGYTVYNTGISGADPVQYKLIAERWIQALKPDFVILNFFMGNDVMPYERIPQPHVPVCFSTNAFNLYSMQQGVAFDNPQEVYDYIVLLNGIPRKSVVNKVFSSTRTTTLLWKFLGFARYLDHGTRTKYVHYRKKAENTADVSYTRELLLQTKAIAEQNGSRFILSIIPELKGTKLVYPRDVKGLPDGLEMHIPEVLESDYDAGDGHFNDSGHRKYADHLEKLIQNRSK